MPKKIVFYIVLLCIYLMCKGRSKGKNKYEPQV